MSDALIGRKIEKVYIDSAREALKFKTSSGFVDGICFADCCSETWIEHISGAEGIVGSVVEKIEEKDIGEGAPTRQEYDQIYSTALRYGPHRTHGYCDEFVIEYRNSSNGYYGGSIEFRDGGDDLGDYTELTEDF